MTAETPTLEQGIFSSVSAVTELEPGRFSAEVDPEWTIGAKPNGGYLLSMLARAATSTSGHDHVIAAPLELTVYVRALPVPGPVRVLQRAQLIEAGRVDESCFVWDMSGRLVAQGTQLAGIRLG